MGTWTVYLSVSCGLGFQRDGSSPEEVSTGETETKSVYVSIEAVFRRPGDLPDRDISDKTLS